MKTKVSKFRSLELKYAYNADMTWTEPEKTYETEIIRLQQQHITFCSAIFWIILASITSFTKYKQIEGS